MTHTATEHTLIGNDNSPERVIADALADILHGDCELGTCGCPPMRDLAKEVLEQLTEHYRLVPRVEHDVNPFVRPYIRGGWVFREAGDSDPSSARLYAAQLLDAADKAEEETR